PALFAWGHGRAPATTAASLAARAPTDAAASGATGLRDIASRDIASRDIASGEDASHRGPA
ncbi:hypothetical protein RZS08_62725, partial [Arthrospira platensis SPKY1]|nr:hypothetical protein [Arthrospira platensis SPKY1]